MRPDCFRSTSGCLPFAGIKEIDDIYLTVIVAVVLAEITMGIVSSKHCVHHKIRHIHVVITVIFGAIYTVRSVILLAVINQVMRQRYRTKHVEYRFIRMVGLIIEVIMCRTGCAVIIVAYFVEHVVESLRRVLIFELHIRELNKDHQASGSKCNFANCFARLGLIHLRCFPACRDLLSGG